MIGYRLMTMAIVDPLLHYITSSMAGINSSPLGANGVMECPSKSINDIWSCNNIIDVSAYACNFTNVKCSLRVLSEISSSYGTNSNRGKSSLRLH